MTVAPGITVPPDGDPPERITVTAADLPDHDHRIASREEMIVAAAKVFARRGPGRHRKPGPPDGWLCLALTMLSGWATTLRACVLLIVIGGVIAGVAALTTPAIGASVATMVTITATLIFGIVAPRRRHIPQL